MNNVLITLGKLISTISTITNRGSGSTWPGHIALTIQKNFIKNLLKNSPTKIILVVGTNGKTTTTKILSTILEANDYKVFENTSGANLLNGIASSLLLNTNTLGKLTADFAIFEVDENNLPLVLKELTPTAIIALDLFRDQLDRYGELDSIAQKWSEAFSHLPPTTHLILNADDPLIAYLGLSQSVIPAKAGIQNKEKIPDQVRDDKPNIIYFGLNSGIKQPLSHAADSVYCPRCSHKLTFSKITYSHLGVWSCKSCGLKRPKPEITSTHFPLEGTYNKYNTLAATAAALCLGLNSQQINSALQTVTPAFGRQEKLSYKGKNIQIFLSKNPTGFNESLRTITTTSKNRHPELVSGSHEIADQVRNDRKTHVLFLLNDRIPDGRDVSWIWDISMEEYVEKFSSIVISGDRCWDMALRIEYSMQFPISNFQFPNNDSNTKYFTEPDLKAALDAAVAQLPHNETLYILPTYSAMLDIRKIITGRKIL